MLEKLKAINNYNPKDFDWNLKNGRVFIIKSYSEDDIPRSIKYSIWCSTEHGNKRLDAAYRSLNGKGPLYLLFSASLVVLSFFFSLTDLLLCLPTNH